MALALALAFAAFFFGVPHRLCLKDLLRSGVFSSLFLFFFSGSTSSCLWLFFSFFLASSDLWPSFSSFLSFLPSLSFFSFFLAFLSFLSFLLSFLSLLSFLFFFFLFLLLALCEQTREIHGRVFTLALVVSILGFGFTLSA